MVKEKTILHRLIAWAEKRCFIAADHALCVSQELAQYITEISDNRTPTTVVPCCIDPQIFDVDWTHVAHLRNELKLVDKPVLLYVGSVSAWNLLDPILAVFEGLLDEITELHLLILTKAVEETHSILIKQSVPLSKVTVLTVPHEKINHYIALGDIGLLLRENNPVNQVASPVKFGEYMACGVPVCVTPYVGDLAEFVKTHQTGIVVDYPLQQPLKHLQEFMNDVLQNRMIYRENCRTSSEFFVRSGYYSKYEWILR